MPPSARPAPAIDLVRELSPFKGWWFWIFVLLTLALAGTLGYETAADWLASRWPQVPCEILQSEFATVRRGNKTYQTPLIRYRYEVGGQSFVSSQIRAKKMPTGMGMERIQELLANHPVGAKTQCHVNPRDSSDAVLEAKPNFLLPLLITPFPIVLWLIYNWVPLTNWLAFRRVWNGPQETQPLEIGRMASKHFRTEVLVGVVSVAFSATLLGFFTLHPWWKAVHSSDWQETPCRILDAAVKTEHHHQGYTFKARLAYDYEFRGKKYLGSKRDFGQSMSTSYADTEVALAQFPPGSTNVCFVNQAAPDQSVLRREVRPDWFLTLFMTGWFGLGVFLGGHGIWGFCHPLESPLPWQTRQGQKLAASEALALRPAQPPGLMVLLCAAGGTACLALTGWLLTGVMRSLQRGGFDLLPALYTLLCGFGCWQCFVHGKKHWRLFRHPPPKIGVSPAVLVSGASAHLAWVWPRGSAQVHPFQLWIEGREETAISTVTPGMHGPMREEQSRKTTFLRHKLGDAVGEIGGKLVFHVPASLMHSFTGQRTKIAWYLLLRIEQDDGDVVEHEHPVVIRPPTNS